MRVRSTSTVQQRSNTSIDITHHVGTSEDKTKTAEPYTYDGDTASGSVESWTMTDCVTPNFQARIARGEVINNPMSYNTEKTTYPGPTNHRLSELMIDAEGRVTGSSWEGSWSLGIAPMQPLLGGYTECDINTESLVAKAVAQSHANASAMEMSTLMFAAEANKSVASLAQIMRRAYKIFKATKKLDLQYLKKQVSRKELEDRYMELRYALRPLVYDAKAVQNALTESKQYKKTRATSRGFAESTKTASDVVTVSGGAYKQYTVNRKVTRTTTVRAGVLSDVVTSGLNVWGFDQWIETAWEIVPFSFIVDWFLNVGDTIAAFTPSAGVRELASWATVKTTRVAQNTLVGFTYEDGHPYNHKAECTYGSQVFSRVNVDFERRVNPSLSVFPVSNINLNTLKLLDLAIIGRKMFS